ncbi:MAG: hypothetical protein ACO28V_05225 [Chitinophagaceae bacterium]
MRGYIYRINNGLYYKCHNCGIGMSVGNLIKEMDANLHKEYIMERYKSGENGSSNYKKPTFEIPIPKFEKRITFTNAISCDKLSEDHSCIKFLNKRQIDPSLRSLFLYTENYKEFCDEIYPDHGKNIIADSRLVIPFYDINKNLIAISGRALENAPSKLRYVTMRTNESKDKLIYGMERINLNDTVYIVEGPIDSLFLKNCLASGDANLALTSKYVNADKQILLFDNEPRNKEVMKMVHKAIKEGHSVVIWPDTVQGKDINEMIMNGLKICELENIISSNTFSGLEALTKFTFWKKYE